MRHLNLLIGRLCSGLSLLLHQALLVRLALLELGHLGTRSVAVLHRLAGVLAVLGGDGLGKDLLGHLSPTRCFRDGGIKSANFALLDLALNLREPAFEFLIPALQEGQFGLVPLLGLFLSLLALALLLPAALSEGFALVIGVVLRGHLALV